MASSRHRIRPPLCALCALVALVALLAPSAALAGGLGRPNVFSALGVGIGGAGFAGVPNPTTLHYNPAGMTLMRETVGLVGLEVVMAPRTYERLYLPEWEDEDPRWSPCPSGGECPAVEDTEGGIIPVPSFAFSTRLAKKGGVNPQPVALGLAFYNTFGGQLSWDKNVVADGITESNIILLEIVPTVAYQVTSQLSVGAGLRIGFGTFSLVNTERKGTELAPSELSGSGVKAGFNCGITYQPLRWLRLGAVYASAMAVEMQGEAQVELDEGKPQPTNVTLTMPWPQWAGLGAALTLDPVNVYLGGKWIDWSSFNNLVIDLSEPSLQDVVERLDFSDGYSLHLGLDWQIHPRFAARAGVAFDSNTVPDKSVERQYLDGPKVTVGAGGSVVVWNTLTVDLAYEILLGTPRDVPDDREVVGTNPVTGKDLYEHHNVAPGTYTTMIHTFALSVRYSY
jgi:long-subunit fatty acid transport protein